MTAAEASKALTACLAAAEQCAKVTDSTTRLMPSTVGELAVAAKTFAEAAATLDRLTRLPATGGLIPGPGVTVGGLVRHLQETDQIRTLVGDRVGNRMLAHPVRVPVLLRDGDNCRFCGHEVEWVGRTTRRSGELYLLEPALTDAAVTAEVVVVACRACTDALQPGASVRHLLMTPPEAAYYSRRTALFLHTRGHEVSAGRHVRNTQTDDADPPLVEGPPSPPPL